MVLSLSTHVDLVMLSLGPHVDGEYEPYLTSAADPLAALQNLQKNAPPCRRSAERCTAQWIR